LLARFARLVRRAPARPATIAPGLSFQAARCITVCNTSEAVNGDRTVRLDAEVEQALQEVQAATGLPISEALKHGLRSLQEQVRREAGRMPYDVYQELDLGPGGYAVAPSTTPRPGCPARTQEKAPPMILVDAGRADTGITRSRSCPEHASRVCGLLRSW
jgi:hypothetical protein